MKTFKRIYYPVLAILCLLFFILSLVDANVGSYKNREYFNDAFLKNVNTHINTLATAPRNEFESIHLAESKDYIKRVLTDECDVQFANSEIDESDSKNTANIFTNAQGNYIPTANIQSAVVSFDTLRKIKSNDSNVINVNKKVENIIVIIPGTDTQERKKSEAVMLMTHYDSVDVGAMDGASSVATMLETIKNVKSNTYKNDLVFVFADAKEGGLFGSYTFFNQFKGFNDLPSRVMLGANFDSFGTGGTMALVDSTKGASKLMSSYAKINKGAYAASSSKYIFTEQTDFLAYGNIPALSFANIGGTTNNNTPADSIANVNKSVIYQQADMMYKICNSYGNETGLASFKASSSDTSFFSFLGMGVINYSAVASYVLGAILALLLIGVILFNVKKRSFKFTKTLMGIFTQLLTVMISVAVMFLFYFLVTLLLAGFGVIPVGLIISLRYTNPAVFIFAIAIAAAISVGCYIFLKKAFQVKAADIVRGNALIMALLGIVMSFVMPSIGFLFVIIGILEMVAMLATTIFKDKYKTKNNEDIERLFLYSIPMILCLPIVLPVIYLATTMASAVLMPIFIGMFLLLTGSILPYANYLTPKAEEIVKKLPKRKMRFERVVTERVEDKAKKGKFSDVTSKKVVTEKVEWRYHNSVAISIVCAICVIGLILSTAFGGDYTQNLVSGKSIDSYGYDGALVLSRTDGGAPTLEVSDLIAYKSISKYVRGFKWNSDRKAYCLEVSNNIITSTPSVTKTPVVKDDRVYPDYPNVSALFTFTTYEGPLSKTTIVLKNTKNITNFIFSSITEDTKYPDTTSYQNIDGSDTMTFVLPRGYGNFTMMIETSADVAPVLEINYSQITTGLGLTESIKELGVLREKFENNKEVEPYLKANVAIRFTQSV